MAIGFTLPRLYVNLALCEMEGLDTRSTERQKGEEQHTSTNDP
jgi:hypothetical protein